MLRDDRVPSWKGGAAIVAMEMGGHFAARLNDAHLHMTPLSTGGPRHFHDGERRGNGEIVGCQDGKKSLERVRACTGAVRPTAPHRSGGAARRECP